MEVFDRIAEQIDAVRLPLFAVTLTALPHANTPVLLMLHWHGFGPDPDGAGASQGPAACSPVPGSALQLNLAWNTIARLDHVMLDAAWQLGAWELDREEPARLQHTGRRGARSDGMPTGLWGEPLCRPRRAFIARRGAGPRTDAAAGRAPGICALEIPPGSRRRLGRYRRG